MNQLEQLAITAKDLGCKVCRDEPMSRHTTFKIGGPADLFITGMPFKNCIGRHMNLTYPCCPSATAPICLSATAASAAGSLRSAGN